MRQIIVKFMWVMVLLGVSSLAGCGMHEKPKTEHITEGRYLVNIINSDQNRCTDKENFFYQGILSVRCYSLKDGSIEYYAKEEGYRMEDFAVWDGDIYYVRSKNEADFELWKQDIQTGEKTMILSSEDIEILNGKNRLNREKGSSHKDYCRVDAYKDYLYFTISGKYEYISPIEGDFMQECIDISTLFQEDDMSGDIQKVIYDGITIERRYLLNGERYDTIGIRDEAGYKILYKYIDTGIWVNGKNVRFTKEAYTTDFKYRKDGGEFHTITCLQDEEFHRSNIEEKHLTVENGKIIGWLSVSRHPNVSWDLYQQDLEKDVLFELDIETGESQILYDTVNNLEKIIGYQDGIIYFAGNDKVYSRELDGGQEKVLFDLPGGQDYMINWQAGYLIIQNEDNIDDVIAYQVSEDRLVGEEK